MYFKILLMCVASFALRRSSEYNGIGSMSAGDDILYREDVAEYYNDGLGKLISGPIEGRFSVYVVVPLLGCHEVDLEHNNGIVNIVFLRSSAGIKLDSIKFFQSSSGWMECQEADKHELKTNLLNGEFVPVNLNEKVATETFFVLLGQREWLDLTFPEELHGLFRAEYSASGTVEIYSTFRLVEGPNNDPICTYRLRVIKKGENREGFYIRRAGKGKRWRKFSSENLIGESSTAIGMLKNTFGTMMVDDPTFNDSSSLPDNTESSLTIDQRKQLAELYFNDIAHWMSAADELTPSFSQTVAVNIALPESSPENGNWKIIRIFFRESHLAEMDTQMTAEDVKDKVERGEFIPVSPNEQLTTEEFKSIWGQCRNWKPLTFPRSFDWDSKRVGFDHTETLKSAQSREYTLSYVNTKFKTDWYFKRPRGGDWLRVTKKNLKSESWIINGLYKTAVHFILKHGLLGAPYDMWNQVKSIAT